MSCRKNSTPSGWLHVAWLPKARPWPTAPTTSRSRTSCPSWRCSTWTLTLSSSSQSAQTSTQSVWCPLATWRSIRTSRWARKPVVLRVGKAVITALRRVKSKEAVPRSRCLCVCEGRCVLWCVCCGIRAASDASQMGASRHQPHLALECIHPSLPFMLPLPFTPPPLSIPGERTQDNGSQIPSASLLELLHSVTSYLCAGTHKSADLWTNARKQLVIGKPVKQIQHLNTGRELACNQQRSLQFTQHICM